MFKIGMNTDNVGPSVLEKLNQGYFFMRRPSHNLAYCRSLPCLGRHSHQQVKVQPSQL
jgi:hypothetical protein